MSDIEYAQRGFRDSRLAMHAVSALPAWLWSPDGMRLLWANAAGAAVFGRRSCPDVITLDITMADPHRLQVAQLAGRLPQNGQPRLERLRGFGAPLGRLMTCACSRLQFADGDIGILIAAAEPSGRTMPLSDRLNRLIEGLDAPVAAFLADGSLSAATASARAIIGENDRLDALGLDALRRDTLETGRAEFASERSRFVLHRVGTGAELAIIAALTPPATAPAESENTTAETVTPEPSAAPETASGPQTGPLTQPAAGAILQDLEAADHFPVLLTRAIEALHAGRGQTASEDAAPAANAPPVKTATEAPSEAFSQASEIPPSASPPPLVSVPAEPQEASPSPQNPFEEPLLPVRRQPLRFMWQMDADGRFSLGADEFSRLMGPRTATAFGRPWREINAAFGIDPEGRIAAAIASRDTWSNLPVAWPVDDGGELTVELSGLPVFDRSQRFIGYRGFGVCRDIDGMERLATLRRQDRFNPSGNAVQAHTDDAGQKLRSVTGEAEAAPSPNVVPFRAPGEAKHPVLTPVENHAFNELARQLTARLNPESDDPPPASEPIGEPETASVVHLSEAAQRDDKPPAAPPRDTSRDISHDVMRPLLDRLPVGVLIYRLDRLIYANRAFLQRTGYADLGALTDAGGLDALFVEPVGPETSSTSETGARLVISTLHDSRDPVDARLFTIPWEEETALALIFSPPGEPQATRPAPALAAPPAPAPLEPDTRDAEIEELKAALAATRQQIEHAATDRSDVLARISHEIRTPMNAIIGFADVMIDERFGPLGNERYAEYLKDVRASGEQIMAMINDMLDLSRAETGKLDLTFTQFALNELVEQCVAVMQPQANRERIIIRTSLAHTLPLIKADMRTARQIIINLIGNAIRLAQAGGQVIVSTALTDDGAVAIRVRDTGAGMSEGEITAALEPFRSPSPVAGDGVSTAGFNLSLTKALAEANRARLAIRSGSHAGTLAEVVFDHSA
jgi:signal transduction histidine kinase